MNSEKLSTIDGIIFELQTLRSAEDEVNKQVSQIIRYTPLWFSILFVLSNIVRKLLPPFALLFIGFMLGANYDPTIKNQTKIEVKSNNLFCPVPESNLKSPSLIPPAGASTINGANTISHGF